MHWYQERGAEEDRQPGEKTSVKEIYGKCGAKDGGRNGNDKVEDRNQKLFWRLRMMGKSRKDEKWRNKNLLIPGDREPVFRLVSLRVGLYGASLGDRLMQRLADLEAEVERRILEEYRWPRDQLWKNTGISPWGTTTNNTWHVWLWQTG